MYNAQSKLLGGGLTPGSQLGPYRIEESIGRGGMGEVFRAVDTRLGRTVAIKTLPHDRLADPERKHRFLQEARAASALNHPHIVGLYDIAQENDVDYQVMEYVVGTSLDRVLRAKGLPVQDALAYACQIADALAAAHAAGVVHRDIKPSNILITKDFQVKLCDFGLAKLNSGAGVQDETQTLPGTLMGTASYMSPEQATGQETDFRTDIFSFGIVLYEMLAGRRPFEGRSSMEVIASILRSEPRPLREIPPQLLAIISKTLEKNRDDRYQNAGDLVVDLRRARRFEERGERVSTPQRISRRSAAWGAAALVGAAATGAAVWKFARVSPGPAPITVAIPVPEGAAAADPGRLLGPPVVAPDGTAVVVSLKTNEGDSLFLRRLDSNQLTKLEGTRGASYPFWSPDSHNIGFFAERKLKHLPVAGGAPVVICDAPEHRGGAWGNSGTIIFGTGRGPLYRVAETGGVPNKITELDKAAGENSHRYPVFLPNGDRFLYFARTDNLDRRGIYLDILSHQQPRRRILVADGQFGLGRDPQSGDAYLLTQQAGKIVAQPFRPDRGELYGEARPLLNRAGQVSVSNTGILVVRNEKLDLSRLAWLDREGRELGILGTPTDYWSVALSRDDHSLAAVKHEYLSGQFTVWVGTVAQGLLEPISGISPALRPSWQKGSTIYYSSPPQKQIFRRTLNPRGAEEVAFEWRGPESVYVADVSEDGRYLGVALAGRNTFQFAWVEVSSRQLHLMKSLVGSPLSQYRFSPDGGWLAYTSEATGSREVYVVDFPQAATPRRVSLEGGRDPQWRGDSKELFFLANDDRMMSVEWGRGREPSASTPKPLFRAEVRRGSEGPLYAVTNNGQRFLIISGMEKAGETEIEVVLNWPGLLR